MALLDRLSNDISVHAFSSALSLWSIGAITKQQIIDRFELDSSDQANLDSLETHYNGLTAAEKNAFKNKLESVLILREEGYLSDEETITLLGL